MEEKTKSRADRLSSVVFSLEAKLADVLEELRVEVAADLCKRGKYGAEQDAFGLPRGESRSRAAAKRELSETLAALDAGCEAVQEAWHVLYHINMQYALDSPGGTLSEREGDI